MANQTVTTNLSLAQVIANGLLDGENITINSSAVVTVNQSSTVLLGNVTINEGEFFIDGANATGPIILVGEQAQNIAINGAGTFRSSLGWWEFPTTSDGTAGQTFDCTSYFAGSLITSDVFSGVWVETGRRINYSGGAGIAPEVGDWVFAVADQSIHGRIVEVNGDGISGYLVVKFLTGSLANGDQIELHTIQNNQGPDYQKSWLGSVVGNDILEPGVFQGFGNARQNATDFLPSAGSGMAGFCFTQAWQSNTLTFGDGTNGFIPPAGARIRVPIIHWATGTVASVGLGESVWITSNANKYELETVNGGDCFLSGLSLGSVLFEDNLGTEFQASFCAANLNFGVYGTASRTRYEDCIFVSEIEGDTRSQSQSVPAVVDMVAGTDVLDCIGVAFNDAGEISQFGGQTSLNVNIERCIHIGLGTSNEVEFLRVTGFTVYDLVVIGTPFVINTSQGSVQLLKTQRDLGGGIAGAVQVTVTASSQDVTITGWEILNDGAPKNAKIQITDSSNITVQGFHFADDPFDNNPPSGGAGEEFAIVGGFCSTGTIARCYQKGGNPNEFIFLAPGIVSNYTILNCGGDYAGEIEPDSINTSIRGLRGGSGSLGSTSGVETDYPGTAGGHCGDVFESDTAGYIFYRSVPGTPEYPLNITAGNPLFLKNGIVSVQAGDQWEVSMGYQARGHLAFTGVLTTARQGVSSPEGTDNWSAVDIEFQYDTGTGFNGTWLDARVPANLIGIGAIETGVELKLRFTATATQTNGQAITIHTTTSLAAQAANLHPIGDFVTITLAPIEPGSSVLIADSAKDTLQFASNISGTALSYDLPLGYVGDVFYVVSKEDRQKVKGQLNITTASALQQDVIVSQPIKLDTDSSPLYTGATSPNLSYTASGGKITANTTGDVDAFAFYDMFQDFLLTEEGARWLIDNADMNRATNNIGGQTITYGSNINAANSTGSAAHVVRADIVSQESPFDVSTAGSVQFISQVLVGGATQPVID